MRTEIRIIGGGWRTEGWIKLLQKFSDKYTIGKVYCRNDKKQRKIRDNYGVDVATDYTEIFTEKPTIVIICVSRESNLSVSMELIRKGINVLCETPLFLSDKDYAEIENSTNYGKLFVAENYPFHPIIYAYGEIIKKRILGDIGSVEIKYCHGYHALSVMRRLLGVGIELPDAVRTIKINDRYSDLYFRYGKIPETVNNHERTISFLRYGDKTAVYDFSHGQYFSPIRERSISVYGEKGEIVGEKVRYIQNCEEFSEKIERIYEGTKGSLFPLDLKRITFNGETVFENPYQGKGLSEEEISMALCIKDKLENLKTNNNIYTLSDSACDCLTAEMMDKV